MGGASTASDQSARLLLTASGDGCGLALTWRQAQARLPNGPGPARRKGNFHPCGVAQARHGGGGRPIPSALWPQPRRSSRELEVGGGGGRDHPCAGARVVQGRDRGRRHVCVLLQATSASRVARVGKTGGVGRLTRGGRTRIGVVVAAPRPSRWYQLQGIQAPAHCGHQGIVGMCVCFAHPATASVQRTMCLEGPNAARASRR